jgi:hypothetical protein
MNETVNIERIKYRSISFQILQGAIKDWKKIIQKKITVPFLHTISTNTDCHELDDCGSIPSRDREGIFLLCHNVQTDSSVHPASYSLGTRGKAANGTIPLLPIHLHGVVLN